MGDGLTNVEKKSGRNFMHYGLNSFFVISLRRLPEQVSNSHRSFFGTERNEILRIEQLGGESAVLLLCNTRLGPIWVNLFHLLTLLLLLLSRNKC